MTEHLAASSADNAFAGTVGTVVPAESARSSPSHRRVPEAIERRYLRVDHSYFFPDRTLAFVDEGHRIRVRTDNREVLHNIVAIVEARGWRVIELRGSEAFRRGMWREATLRDIEVRGYEPTEVELAQVRQNLARARAHRPLEGEHGSDRLQGRTPDPGQRGRQQDLSDSDSGLPRDRDAAMRAQPAADARTLRDGPRPAIKGTLMAAAAAPYQFDPGARMSFYVQVRTAVGDRTLWGADLERALAESASHPRIGDAVVLQQHGSRPVNVRVPAHNDQGELVGEKKIVAQRARWTVETPEHLEKVQERARRFGAGALPESELQQHPELASAGAALQLARQYAQRVTRDPDSQERLMGMIREQVALALAQGREIRLPERREHGIRMGTPIRERQRSGARNREEPIHERE